jgi:hypothetical protein
MQVKRVLFLTIAALCLSSCGSHLDLMVINDYDFPVKIKSENKGWEIMTVAAHGATWQRSVVSPIGPNTPFIFVVEDNAGKEIERRQIRQEEADGNMYDNRLVVISIGAGKDYHRIQLAHRPE